MLLDDRAVVAAAEDDVPESGLTLGDTEDEVARLEPVVAGDHPLLERKLVEDGLQADMKACVVDYLDRTLRNRAEDATDEGVGIEQLVWQFGQYTREFTWEWPTDVPAVGFEAGNTYRNTMTDEYIDVVEPVTGNRNALNSFEVKRYAPDTDPAEVEPEIMDSSTIVDLIVTRSLLVEVQSAPSIERHDSGSGQPT